MREEAVVTVVVSQQSTEVTANGVTQKHSHSSMNAQDLGQAAYTYAAWLHASAREAYRGRNDYMMVNFFVGNHGDYGGGKKPSQSTVKSKCRAGLVPGAFLMNSRYWLLPAHITTADFLKDPPKRTLFEDYGEHPYSIRFCLSVTESVIETSTIYNSELLFQDTYPIDSDALARMKERVSIAPRRAMIEVGGGAKGHYISKGQAAKRWNVNDSTVFRWLRSGLVPGAFTAEAMGKKRIWVIPSDVRVEDVDREGAGLASKRYTAPNPRHIALGRVPGKGGQP